MFIKSLYRAALVSSLMLFAASSFGATVTTTVTMTATVDPFVEWSTPATTIGTEDWTGGHITGLSQNRTATVNLTIYTNASPTISTSSSSNAGVLTNGTQTLTTEYKLTGDAAIASQDAIYKDATIFLTNSYLLTHVGGTGSYALALDIKASSPAANAPDAGNYTANVILTATW